jgi:hypothetical protein
MQAAGVDWRIVVYPASATTRGTPSGPGATSSSCSPSACPYRSELAQLDAGIREGRHGALDASSCGRSTVNSCRRPPLGARSSSCPAHRKLIWLTAHRPARASARADAGLRLCTARTSLALGLVAVSGLATLGSSPAGYLFAALGLAAAFATTSSARNRRPTAGARPAR